MDWVPTHSSEGLHILCNTTAQENFLQWWKYSVFAWSNTDHWDLKCCYCNQLTFKFYLILINFKRPVWLVAKNSPMLASTKITFKVSLLWDKVSKHKAETMEEGRTCVTQKKANLSRKKNWTAHLKIRNYGLELKEIRVRL